MSTFAKLVKMKRSKRTCALLLFWISSASAILLILRITNKTEKSTCFLPQCMKITEAPTTMGTTKPVTKACVDTVKIAADLSEKVNVLSNCYKSDWLSNKMLCFPLPASPKHDIEICVNPSFVSESVLPRLLEGNLKNVGQVAQMTKALTKLSKVTMVDLGVGFGEFTLSAAAIGRHVVAVEHNNNTIAMLHFSLNKNKLSSKVILVNNIVSHERNSMSKEKQLRGLKLTQKAICLDELLPLIKSDSVYLKISTNASDILKCAEKFFANVNVRVIHLVWGTGMNVTYVERFMKQHGYLASHHLDKLEPVVFWSPHATPTPQVPFKVLYFLRESEF